ncbi:phosphoribosyltransferase family protein [Cellulomonas sp. ATA003]|uniref:phosphoribosyltransferase family protein n=1 Tax=Cellulomonas sp. ATA003 TaxID=3073064 RepID=UPI0028737232|nr:phosphoribosyltransferase family protein [Cellulomonas sp. ATA003]WNB85440.1 phosphoribosyltransferase family protein [Cellulomonas sp. ATA003]
MCAELTHQVRAFAPDVVVGIATGGSEIAEEIADELGGCRLVVVRSQRPGTLLKQGRHASRVLSWLPERLANLARWVEVEYREARYYLDERARGPEPVPTGRIREPEALADAVLLASRVLVVDDTLDSGQTIRGVVEAVRAANPTAEVRTAVIATTWRRPPMTPTTCSSRACCSACPRASMPDRAPGAVLAADLDGTVVGINTFPSFVRFLTRELARERRAVALASLVATGVLRRAHLARHEDLKRRVCVLGATLPAARVATWARGCWPSTGSPTSSRSCGTGPARPCSPRRHPRCTPRTWGGCSGSTRSTAAPCGGALSSTTSRGRRSCGCAPPGWTASPASSRTTSSSTRRWRRSLTACSR